MFVVSSIKAGHAMVQCLLYHTPAGNKSKALLHHTESASVSMVLHLCN